MKYYIMSMGCQMNTSDSERIATMLEKIGYTKTSSERDADFIVLNTCSVRQSAENRIYGKMRIFREYKKQNQNLRVMITGCVPGSQGDAFRKKVPDADYVVNIQDIPKIPEMVKKSKESQQFTTPMTLKEQNDEYFTVPPMYNSRFRAYVPISIGCNKFCTYCIVPKARGREKSRSSKDIREECELLVKNGYKDIMLLGQNVNSYGNDNKEEMSFPELLERIADISGDFWVRYLSAHPYDMSDELIELMGRHKKITPYVHLPVQSGSDSVLKCMNRHYTVAHYLERMKKIRATIPNVMISTDIVVGFCGETEEDFQKTLELCRKVEYDMVYSGIYSPRKGTFAAEHYEDDVSMPEKKKRDKELNAIIGEIALRHNQDMIGTTVTVLPEKISKGMLQGKTDTFKTVKIVGDNVREELIGTFVQVSITEAGKWGVVGKIV